MPDICRILQSIVKRDWAFSKFGKKSGTPDDDDDDIISVITKSLKDDDC